MFDAIDTLFGPKGMTFEEYVHQNVEKVLGRPIRVSADRLQRCVNEIIMELSRKERLKLQKRGRVQFRGWLNARALTRLGYKCSNRQGEAISRLTYRGIRFFVISRERRGIIGRLIRSLRRQNPGARVVVVTNANGQNVRMLLRKHGIKRLFDAVYVAKEIGVTKAKSKYFLRVLGLEGVKPPEARMIGNSGKSDLIAAMLGIITVWLSSGKAKLSIGEVRALHGFTSRRFIIKLTSWKQLDRLCV
jgi:FMN phosphatase YigB (HAD superfamily)